MGAGATREPLRPYIYIYIYMGACLFAGPCFSMYSIGMRMIMKMMVMMMAMVKVMVMVIT